MSVVDKNKASSNDHHQSTTGVPAMTARTNVDNRRGFARGNNQRRQNRSKYGGGSGGSGGSGGVKAASFKGETSGLNGNVFQLQEESRDPGQSRRTLNAIEQYVNKTFDCDFGSCLTR